MYIWTNARTIRLIADHQIYPKRYSQILFDTANRMYGTRMIAEYESIKELQTIAEELYTDGCFWRQVGRASVGMDEIESNDKPYRPRVMRKMGLLEYLCDYCGVSTERNVAAVVGEMAHHEGKNPIDFFNSIPTLGYDR